MLLGWAYPILHWSGDSEKLLHQLWDATTNPLRDHALPIRLPYTGYLIYPVAHAPLSLQNQGSGPPEGRFGCHTYSDIYS